MGRGRQAADSAPRHRVAFQAVSEVKGKINRNLALELLRVTEAGALAAAPLQGRGNKEAADLRAVEAIREALADVDMKGTVVIGEGEKDKAPMLYFGEQIGNGLEPAVDVAVDPIEGTSLTASGLPGAISVVALAERGSMFTTHVPYMLKLVVGRRARGVIDLDMPVEWNLLRIAGAEGLPVQELTVVVLERERNREIIAQIRDVGARIKLITAGDVAGALEATGGTEDRDLEEKPACWSRNPGGPARASTSSDRRSPHCRVPLE